MHKQNLVANHSYLFCKDCIKITPLIWSNRSNIRPKAGLFYPDTIIMLIIEEKERKEQKLKRSENTKKAQEQGTSINFMSKLSHSKQRNTSFLAYQWSLSSSVSCHPSLYAKRGWWSQVPSSLPYSALAQRNLSNQHKSFRLNNNTNTFPANVSIVSSFPKIGVAFPTWASIHANRMTKKRLEAVHSTSGVSFCGSWIPAEVIFIIIEVGSHPHLRAQLISQHMNDVDILNSLSKVNRDLFVLSTDILVWRHLTRQNASRIESAFKRPQRPDRRSLADKGILRMKSHAIERGEYAASRGLIQLNDLIRKMNRKMVEQKIIKKLNCRPDVEYLR